MAEVDVRKGRCPQCGASYTISRGFAEWRGSGDLKMVAAITQPRYCPGCGHDFELDLQEAMWREVRRSRG